MKTTLLCIFFGCVGIGLLFGQDTAAVKIAKDKVTNVSTGDVALALQLAIPTKGMQEAIQNKMGNIGVGASLLLLTNPFTWGKHDKNSPLRIGAEIAYTYYGRFITDVTVNGYQGDYKTSYGIANLNALVRLRPPQTSSSFNPFVDLIAGGNFYISSTKENLSVIESALGADKLDFGGTSSASFSKGLGFGFSAGSRLAEQPGFVFRATYNRGRAIKYVGRNSLAYDPNTSSLTYERAEAPVEYFLIQVGIGM